MSEVLELTRSPSAAGAVLTGLLHRRPDGTAGLPPRIIVLPEVHQDLDRLAAYSRVCGFALRDHVPATWLHVLTFGLQTTLMAQPDFPFTVLGLVHTANTMTLHRPVHHTEVLRVQVRAAHLRPHRRGATFELLGEVVSGSEVVWSGTSTYLARGGRAPAPRDSDGAEPDVHRTGRDDLTPVQHAQTWRLPPDLGRDYARVSGDLNPIHLHPLAARAFGFRTTIVHGMWTLARSLAALEGRAGPAHRLDARFTSPVPLPSTVHFATTEQGAEVRFAVLAAGTRETDRAGTDRAEPVRRVHLDGRVVRL